MLECLNKSSTLYFHTSDFCKTFRFSLLAVSLTIGSVSQIPRSKTSKPHSLPGCSCGFRGVSTLVSLRCSCIHIVLGCSKEHLPGKLDLPKFGVCSQWSHEELAKTIKIQIKYNGYSLHGILKHIFIYIYIDIVISHCHKNYSTHHLVFFDKKKPFRFSRASFSAISGRFRLRPPPRPSKFPGFPPVATHVTMPAEAASLSQLQGKQDSHETDSTNKTWWFSVSLTYYIVNSICVNSLPILVAWANHCVWPFFTCSPQTNMSREKMILGRIVLLKWSLFMGNVNFVGSNVVSIPDGQTLRWIHTDGKWFHRSLHCCLTLPARKHHLCRGKFIPPACHSPRASS